MTNQNNKLEGFQVSGETLRPINPEEPVSQTVANTQVETETQAKEQLPIDIFAYINEINPYFNSYLERLAYALNTDVQTIKRELTGEGEQTRLFNGLYKILANPEEFKRRYEQLLAFYQVSTEEGTKNFIAESLRDGNFLEFYAEITQ